MLGLKCVIADKAAPASFNCLEITNRKAKRIEEEKWKKAERERALKPSRSPKTHCYSNFRAHREGQKEKERKGER